MLAVILAEVLCVIVLALGVGLTFGLGPALIVGGLSGVLACEWIGAKVLAASARAKKRGGKA